MMPGSQIDGLILLRMMLEGGSAAQYIKKNAVRHLWSSVGLTRSNSGSYTYQLYWPPVKFKSSARPSIFALPMLPLSMNERRYNSVNIGSSLISIFRNSFFSSIC